VRAVIQRVTEAQVTVGDNIVVTIGSGLCVFLGIGKEDREINARALADKIISLRIFEDDHGKMNHSISKVGGELLVVSQFTLHGDYRKGNRPSFSSAAEPGKAVRLYEYFSQCLRDAGVKVANGQFQAHMKVSLVNDGPVTFFLEL
jgi:D-tyrosyl-tRNA(Tyr) deacylase